MSFHSLKQPGSRAATRSSGVRALTAGIALALLGATVHADAQSASVPNFSGFWNLDVSGMHGPKDSPADMPEGWRNFGTVDQPGPSLRPEVFAQVKAQRIKEGTATDIQGGLDPETAACNSGGFPDFISFFDPLDIHQRADEILMVTERERQLPRHIYIVPEHPIGKNYVPAENGLTFREGHSLGHWQGQDLIVDTDSFMEGPWMFSIDRIPHSDAMTTHEVYSLSADGQTMTDVLTINDPKTLAKPWVLKYQWHRAPRETEAFEGECHVDLKFLNDQAG